MATQTNLESAREALSSMQQFDIMKLPREDYLGKQLSFSEAIDPSRALVDIYKRIPLSALDDFSDNQLLTITQEANTDLSIFNQMLQFEATAADAASTREGIINSVGARRDQCFERVFQYIAYGITRTADATLFETQARAILQTVEDRSKQNDLEISEIKRSAEAVMDQIRAVAAEQGVSQQAIYFRNEAEEQEKLAAKWLKYTYSLAVSVGVFAVLSLFLHKINWIRPENFSEMFQLVSSKLLIFAVLGYLLLMSSRNYSTHKHNAVINRHRQNALLTYRSLVDAAHGTEDIVLAHAASCIFSPQETGFSSNKGESIPGSKSVLELLTKSAAKE